MTRISATTDCGHPGENAAGEWALDADVAVDVDDRPRRFGAAEEFAALL
jgi:hypothetical protein